jgi:hypothetical protein
VTQQDWQGLEDTYLEHLNGQLAEGVSLSPAGKWNWPAYGVTLVSAVVLGSRAPEQPAESVQLVYFVTVFSQEPIPDPGEAMRETSGEGSYIFVQRGASVGVTHYQTQFLSAYVGPNPYPGTRPFLARASDAPVPTDNGSGGQQPPHPPP